MSVHDLSAGGDVLQRVGASARDVLRRYDSHPSSSLTLLNVSENATFIVDDPDRGRSILRVHRLGYHSPEAVASELAWMDALRADAGVRTARVLPAAGGRRIVTAVDEASGQARCFVMFELLTGSEPERGDVASFERLGALTARMHDHARRWELPARFTRFHWNYDAAFGHEARWGRWQHGVGVGREEAGILSRLEGVLAERLAVYGTGPDRYGLIHADTRLANLLVAGDEVSVIDFDDCGFGWYLYDLGASVSFFEHEAQVPELLDGWMRGYRGVRPLPAADEAEAWTFVLFRRLLLLAWIGTHPAADIARELGAGYTAGTCAMAECYLRGWG